MRNISTFAPQSPQQMAIVPDVDVIGRRIVATLLDFVLLSVLIILVDSTFGINQYTSSLSYLPGIPYTSSTVVASPWLYLVMMTYYTAQEALFSTTIGKALMGLRVVLADGRPIAFRHAFVRNIVRPIDAVGGCVLGWILAVCSSRRRRLGDHLAHTLVASVASVPVFSLRRSEFWLRLSSLAILCALFLVFCLGFDYYGRPPLIVQSLTNANANAPIFTDRGTISDLTLSQPTWKNSTVTYALTFHAYRHEVMSNCSGDITLTWSGFIGGWSVGSGDTTCNLAASHLT